MKKNIFIIIIIIIFTLYLFIYSNIISIITIDISLLFIKKVLPFILSFYIISNILINYNLPYYIAKIFNNNIYIFILIMSFFSGCPSNTILIKELYNQKIINVNQANKYIQCTFFNNPLFIYTMFNEIFDIKTSIIIIIIQFISNIIIYIIKPCKNSNIVYKKSKNISICINDSIKNIIPTLLNIYITILLYNYLIVILPTNKFIGLLEITTGLNQLKYLSINNTTKLIISIIYISFGGLSIHSQIKSVLIDTNINYNKFLISRIYNIIISLILILLFF